MSALIARTKHLQRTHGTVHTQEMRAQFGSMLSDARLLPASHSHAAGGRGRDAAWLDDGGAAWNAHARDPAVVRFLHLVYVCVRMGVCLTVMAAI